MKQRRLITTRRLVSPERREEYDAGWARLHAAATARGAHAWRFETLDRADVFVEFLEFATDQDPRDDSETAMALRALETAFAAEAPPAPSVEELRSVAGE